MVVEAAWKTVEWSVVGLLAAVALIAGSATFAVVALTAVFEKVVAASADGGTAVSIAGSATFAAVALTPVFENVAAASADGGIAVLTAGSATIAACAA